MKLTKTYEVESFKKLPDENGKSGRFEAVVSVFGNVDTQGDRVVPGSFSKSISNWRSKGDPIPVIWSHDWDNPFAHIGWVDPNEVEEVIQAKSGMPGGLKVLGQIDIHKEFAKQVYDLMDERRVREWSFAYDVFREKRASDGANDLLELGIIEVGPTLKGANKDTYTLGVKAAMDLGRRADEEGRKLTPQEVQIINMAKRADDLGDGELAGMVRMQLKSNIPADATPEEMLAHLRDVHHMTEEQLAEMSMEDMVAKHGMKSIEPTNPKHGDHDQSTHGRRDGGGSDTAAETTTTSAAAADAATARASDATKLAVNNTEQQVSSAASHVDARFLQQQAAEAARAAGREDVAKAHEQAAYAHERAITAARDGDYMTEKHLAAEAERDSGRAVALNADAPEPAATSLADIVARAGKAGKVIGSQRVNSLKLVIDEAIDAWVDEVNGGVVVGDVIDSSVKEQTLESTQETVLRAKMAAIESDLAG